MKKRILAGLLCCILAVLTGCSNREDISYELIEDRDLLCEEVSSALEQELGDDIISLYMHHGAWNNEYLIHYVRDYGKNYYQTLKVKTYTRKNILIIVLNAKDAENDNDVTDELTAYFTLDKEPDDIQVFVDDELAGIDNIAEVDQIKKDGGE